MAILPLVIAPDPTLKKISKKVEKIDDGLIQTMNDMVETMYSERGIGLAGVQVGFLKRVIVMDVDYRYEDHDHEHHHDHENCGGVHVKNTNPQYFINPEILTSDSEKSSYNEGCLSFPEMRAEVFRPKSIKLKFTDLEGKEHIKEFDGISATCLQHEIDHLNGVTFVDRISPLKREIILKKMKKFYKK